MSIESTYWKNVSIFVQIIYISRERVDWIDIVKLVPPTKTEKLGHSNFCNSRIEPGRNRLVDCIFSRRGSFDTMSICDTQTSVFTNAFCCGSYCMKIYLQLNDWFCYEGSNSIYHSVEYLSS